MKRVHTNVAYIVLSLAALVVASGAPIPWSGSGGGGGGINAIIVLTRIFG
jgi:hypothetical protein